MTNKNPIITAFAAVSLAALALSCSKSEIQNAYSQQDKDIESIVFPWLRKVRRPPWTISTGQ